MNCIDGTKDILKQIDELLEALGPGEYAKPLQIYNGSTLGQHFRHIFDFYHCLTRAEGAELLDYGDRERDPKLESDPAYARSRFNAIADLVEVLDEEAGLEVLADFSADQNRERPVVRSSMGRELMFAHDHAIHHIAIIKMGFRVAFPAISIPENMGLAPSTIKYRSEQKVMPS